MIRVEGISKTFVMHLHGGQPLQVLCNVSLSLSAGECVALSGPSGAGKSTLLKMIFGNYRCDSGRILVQQDEETIDMARATPRRVMNLRRTHLGYVSQFLRVIPRVGALDLVMEAALESGVARDDAKVRAQHLLERLNIPTRLWNLAPATFSGGEQQRINIARQFVTDRRILLLDEPTASLDAGNVSVVEDLIREKKQIGTALLAILHDVEVRNRVADRLCPIHAIA